MKEFLIEHSKKLYNSDWISEQNVA